MNIAFDLDNTLIDIESVIRELMCKDNIEYCRTNCFRIETNPIISRNEVWSYIEEAYTKVWDLQPLPGAVALLKKLHEKTKEPVKIITARPIRAANVTHSLVQIYFPVPYELVFVEGWQMKLCHLKNFCYFVDDRRRTALQLATNNKIVFVPQRLYNKVDNHPDNFVYINEVCDLIPLIDEFI